MTPREILRSVLSSPANVRFTEFVKLVRAFGFVLARTRGSHHIFRHSGVRELVNLQEYQGEAKPYQIRQFLRIVERYNLSLETDEP